MAPTVTIDLRQLTRGLNIPLRQVQAVVELLDEGNTVPFITRYRKDRTGGLDEEQIRQIQSRLAKARLLADRKQTILRSIESQGKLSEKLTKQILAAHNTKRLEDLYLPFRPKKQTLATVARSRGLEVLATEILRADPVCADLDARAADFVNPDREVPTAADALLGAGHILAEQFSERADVRQRLREVLQRTGRFLCTQADASRKPIAAQAPPQPAIPRRPAPPQSLLPDQAQAERKVEPSSAAAAAPATPQTTQPQAASAADVRPSEDTSAAAAGQRPAQAIAEPHPQDAAADDPATPGPNAAEETAGGSGQAGESGPVGEAGSPGQPSDDTPRPPVSAGSPPAEEATSRSNPASSADPERSSPQPPQPDPGSAEPLALGAQPGAVDQGEAGSSASSSSPPAAAAARPPQRPRWTKEHLSKKQLKKKRDEERKIKAFADYFHYQEEIRRIPPHRLLAINRGERAKVLRVKIEADLAAMHQAMEELLVPADHPHAEYLRGCARDALQRLILPSLEREIRRELTDRAEAHAVEVFARNLRNLLLQPPVRDRRVLAVDPGYRSGCKLAALDQFGNLLDHGVVYLVGRPERTQEAKQKVIDLVERFQLSTIAIGNGTACRQCEEFFGELLAAELKDRGLVYVIVNEAGASVYSTSAVGREEFPDYDASLRGAISIGRRLQDPLSELVKIDPANIGVGLYQHDVKAKHLRASLDEVVESCVNYVGVDVNTASPSLLRYISGLNQLTARRICEHRQEHGPFRTRQQFREVPGVGEATFVQAAGFLKITGGDNPLDSTWIHPESYHAATEVLAHLNYAVSDLADPQKLPTLAERLTEVNLERLAGQLGVGSLTLADIISQLARPGRDPRESLPPPVFKRGVLKLEDLQTGMELSGTVLNVVDFGAFVDIGMHDSGLVHVSQLADRFVRDPHEVVAVGDIVRVWVVDVDKQRRRVSLTMIPPDTQRSRQSGRGQQGGGRRGSPPRSSQEGRRRSSPPKPTPGAPPTKAKGDPPPKRRSRGKRPPKTSYRPKSTPKPVVPITEAMKAGKEPMRTFGDLAQFFEHQQKNPTESSPALESSECIPSVDAHDTGPKEPASETEKAAVPPSTAESPQPAPAADTDAAAVRQPPSEASPPSDDQQPSGRPAVGGEANQPTSGGSEPEVAQQEARQPQPSASETLPAEDPSAPTGDRCLEEVSPEEQSPQQGKGD